MMEAICPGVVEGCPSEDPDNAAQSMWEAVEVAWQEITKRTARRSRLVQMEAMLSSWREALQPTDHGPIFSDVIRAIGTKLKRLAVARKAVRGSRRGSGEEGGGDVEATFFAKSRLGKSRRKPAPAVGGRRHAGDQLDNPARGERAGVGAAVKAPGGAPASEEGRRADAGQKWDPVVLSSKDAPGERRRRSGPAVVLD
mmetsp:Transcript_18527/g.51186  ORF Transcript_18527/g.51186 Transcript_18527/m.51186 type:complete len:198 (+) Transcript_18527:377-970(+)